VDLNGLAQVITIREGSLPLPEPATFDVVVANIIARVIVELARPLAAVVRPGGILVASGIIVDRAAMVEQSLHQAGLQLVQRDINGDWVTLSLAKSS
jgi:ribosomal protein L11 methyltransferase